MKFKRGLGILLTIIGLQIIVLTIIITEKIIGNIYQIFIMLIGLIFLVLGIIILVLAKKQRNLQRLAELDAYLAQDIINSKKLKKNIKRRSKK